MSDSLQSPNEPTAPQLPSKPGDGSALNTPSQASTPVPPVPKTRGGFEDDDDQDQEESTLEEDPDDDVYDPSLSLETNGATHDIPQPSFDSVAKSPAQEAQENGSIPVPTQASMTPANPSLVSDSYQPVPVHQSSTLSVPTQSSAADLSNVPKSRLAHDVVGMLEDRIKEDPRGDIPAWLELLEEFKSRNKEDDVRRTYDRYFEYFPLDAESWCALVRWEEANDRKFKMEEVFRKALMQIPSVDLWSIYINYVRRRNSMSTGPTATKAYTVINNAFELALKQVGMDKDSGNLWQEYINFLKSGPGTVGGTGWQDNQKMDTLREAYKKALCMPTGALHTLWTEYQAFETGINKMNGRKFFQERSPDYMDSRRNFTLIQNMTKDLSRTTKPRLPPAMGYEGDVQYQQQVAIWKQWIEWEKEDNLALKEEKLDSYLDRVLFTYRQALMALQFWPEIWYDAAQFCFANGKDDEGLKFLEQGFQSNPESSLLAFKLADRLETTTTNDDVNDPGAKQRMAKIREPYNRVLDALYAIDQKTDARMQADIQRVEALEASQTNGDDDLNASNVAAKKAALDAQIQAVKASSKAHLDMLSRIIAHVWIALMRCTRRVQGKGLPSEKGGGFRAILTEARKRGRLTPEFWVEAASIEWQCYRDAAGTRIFNIGMKLYPDDNYLPLEYIKHLISKDDLVNARAIFETTVGKFTSSTDPAMNAKAKPLFVFFHDFESKYGDLSQIQRLETRMQQYFPEDPLLQLFSSRFHTAGFDPMSVHPIISQTQIRAPLHPSIEISNSPMQRVIDQITSVSSPKRPLTADGDDDEQPRKIARGESPFKGAAGRRVAQAQAQAQAQPARPPIPPPFPAALTHLISVLPKASAYTDQRFDAAAMHRLIRDVHLPPPGSAMTSRPPQPLPPTQLPAPNTPTWPPQFGQHPPPPLPPAPQGFMPPGAGQPQYPPPGPFRYA